MIDREDKDKLLALRSMVQKELKRHPLSVGITLKMPKLLYLI